jgi:PPM family protein phosphatase
LKISLRHAGLSDVGRQREVNEDSFCAIPQLGLFVVADGMGGHKAGDVASKMATEAITQFFTDTEGEDSTWPFHFDPQRSYEENRLLAGVKLANRRIYEASIESLDVQGMGTTVVSCVFAATGGKVYIGHVGDSRCYRLRDGELELLTRDHSLVNDYRQAMPHLTDEQMAALPRNVITRALGMQESVVVDIQSIETEAGDVYLLCSDGLSESMTDEEMFNALKDHADDLDTATRKLVSLANAHGGDDNITVLLVSIDGANRPKRDPKLVETRKLINAKK